MATTTTQTVTTQPSTGGTDVGTLHLTGAANHDYAATHNFRHGITEITKPEQPGQARTLDVDGALFTSVNVGAGGPSMWERLGETFRALDGRPRVAPSSAASPPSWATGSRPPPLWRSGLKGGAAEASKYGLPTNPNQISTAIDTSRFSDADADSRLQDLRDLYTAFNTAYATDDSAKTRRIARALAAEAVDKAYAYGLKGRERVQHFVQSLIEVGRQTWWTRAGGDGFRRAVNELSESIAARTLDVSQAEISEHIESYLTDMYDVPSTMLGSYVRAASDQLFKNVPPEMHEQASTLIVDELMKLKGVGKKARLSGEEMSRLIRDDATVTDNPELVQKLASSWLSYFGPGPVDPRVYSSEWDARNKLATDYVAGVTGSCYTPLSASEVLKDVDGLARSMQWTPLKGAQLPALNSGDAKSDRNNKHKDSEVASSVAQATGAKVTAVLGQIRFLRSYVESSYDVPESDSDALDNALSELVQRRSSAADSERELAALAQRKGWARTPWAGSMDPLGDKRTDWAEAVRGGAGYDPIDPGPLTAGSADELKADQEWMRERKMRQAIKAASALSEYDIGADPSDSKTHASTLLSEASKFLDYYGSLARIPQKTVAASVAAYAQSRGFKPRA
ncbi:hypothetical protein Q5752_006241 [Cryptotrichosporon argae]